MVVLHHPNIDGLSIERTGADVIARWEKAGWVKDSTKAGAKRRAAAKNGDTAVLQPETEQTTE